MVPVEVRRRPCQQVRVRVRGERRGLGQPGGLAEARLRTRFEPRSLQRKGLRVLRHRRCLTRSERTAAAGRARALWSP